MRNLTDEIKNKFDYGVYYPLEDQIMLQFGEQFNRKLVDKILIPLELQLDVVGLN